MSLYDSGLVLVAAHWRNLLTGRTVAAPHTAVQRGHFVDTPPRLRLVEHPESLFSKRPVEVEWGELTQPDGTGPAPIVGDKSESSSTMFVRVGYLQGGGTAGDGDRISVADEMARDEKLIRLMLQEQANFDEDTTGLMQVLRVRAKPNFATGADRRALLEIEFRVRIRDTDPTEFSY